MSISRSLSVIDAIFLKLPTIAFGFILISSNFKQPSNGIMLSYLFSVNPIVNLLLARKYSLPSAGIKPSTKSLYNSFICF